MIPMHRLNGMCHYIWLACRLHVARVFGLLAAQHCRSSGMHVLCRQVAVHVGCIFAGAPTADMVLGVLFTLQMAL
jgi:hypothetical protein